MELQMLFAGPRTPIGPRPPFVSRKIHWLYSVLWHTRFVLQNESVGNDLERRLREAILEQSRSYGRGPTLDLPRISRADINGRDFATIYRNFPVIIEGLLADTKAYRSWTLDYFASNYGKTVVPVAKQYVDGGASYEEVQLGDFIGSVREQSDRPRYLMASSTLFDKHRELLDELQVARLGELFDRTTIRAEIFMGSGANGSPYHCASSGNFFCNVHGRKDWLLAAPQHSMWMYPQIGRNGLAVYVNSPVLSDKSDEIEERFPLYNYIPKYSARLAPGDVLYVPPWWWHEVTNRGECIGVPVRIADSGGGNLAFSLFQLTMLGVAPQASKMLLPVGKQVLKRALAGRRDLDGLYLSDELTKASHASSRVYERGWRRYFGREAGGLAEPRGDRFALVEPSPQG